MDQSALYEILYNSSCKIISFEDYPYTSGSWRISFYHLDCLCEVISNRNDQCIYLTLKTRSSKSKQKKISTGKNVTDEDELEILKRWLRFSF